MQTAKQSLFLLTKGMNYMNSMDVFSLMAWSFTPIYWLLFACKSWQNMLNINFLLAIIGQKYNASFFSQVSFHYILFHTKIYSIYIKSKGYAFNNSSNFSTHKKFNFHAIFYAKLNQVFHKNDTHFGKASNTKQANNLLWRKLVKISSVSQLLTDRKKHVSQLYTKSI